MDQQEHEDPFAIAKPDWTKWLPVKTGKLWQAAALACNHDPSNFRFFNDGTLSPFARCSNEFTELLALAKHNVGGRLKTIAINKAAIEESEVSFPEFFSWLKKIGYELPQELLGSVNSEATPLTEDTPLGERERATLLTLIAALCDGADIDITKPAKAASIIEGLTLRIGSRIASRTIVEHLKRIPAALEKRQS